MSEFTPRERAMWICLFIAATAALIAQLANAYEHFFS